MRVVPAVILDSVGGSVPDARLSVEAWYDGRLVEADVPVENWSLSWDGGDSDVVQGKLRLTVADGDGSLSPWGWDEALSAGGSRLHCSWVQGGESVPVGRFLIDSNAPNETWRVAGPNLAWVPGGSSLPVTGQELTRLALDDRILAAESPASGATWLGEVRRLLQDVCGVVVADGVVDAPVPTSMVYDKSRGAHAHDLIRSYGYHHRMTGAGALEVHSRAKSDPVWVVEGRQGGALVTVSRSQSRDDIVNGVLSTSNNSSFEIKRLAKIDEGPLRFGGPVGRLVLDHTALADTDDGVARDAQTHLESKAVRRTVKLSVSCLPHPGVQVGDWVRVAHPVIGGSQYPLDGLVTSVGLSGGPGGVDDMRLTVEVSAEDAAAVGLHVRRSRG